MKNNKYIIEGFSIQEEKPTPDYPKPIATAHTIVIKDMKNNIIKEIPLGDFELTGNDKIVKINNKWYLHKEKKTTIQVGEYCRTKNGIIGKCLKTSFDFEDGKYCNDFITIEPLKIGKITIPNNMAKKDIIKHSKDILDLIEARRLCKWIQSLQN